jgi:large subunit ribosomal protein LX
MAYKITGSFRIGDRYEKYEKTIEAKDEADARELIYSLFGSEHGTKRRFMKIDSIAKAAKA